MIALSSSQGALVKVLSNPSTDGTYGFHSLFGFIGEETCQERLKIRENRGLRAGGTWLCRFQLSGGQAFALEGCSVEQAESAWKVLTGFGQFLISSTPAQSIDITDSIPEKSNRTLLAGAALATLLAMFLIFRFSPYQEAENVVPQILEPVIVKIFAEKQRAVNVPNALELPKEFQQANTSQVAKRAIQQNLGFLGFLGRKDLKKALGGATTSITDASPGAGAGGKEGSGGELLQGLGQGVKRTTVGSSGVAGLGGIGTKGVGGGQGGYGNSMVGSGEGRGLSKVPLSQDMVLDGGLDKSVIQATIAKYLSQVRACYEDGLRKSPGIGGQVTMNFEINALGGLNYSNVAKSSLSNAEVESCIGTRMMGWKFPKPLGGVNVKVNYPFLLRPVGA